MPFPFYTGDIPYLTTEQMIEVDRAMIKDYHVKLVQMMENAGRNLAQVARLRFLDGDAEGKTVLVLAGTGGNGGGALVAARRLHNYGAKVQVVISRLAEAFAAIPAHQLDIVRQMGIAVYNADALHQLSTPQLIVDGIIGYSVKGAPRGSSATMIQWANQAAVPILSLDAPSGVDAAAGVVYDPAIRAKATLTLALPKVGLRAEVAQPNVGELYLADISVPSELYARPPLNLQVGHIFAESDIIRLW